MRNLFFLLILPLYVSFTFAATYQISENQSKTVGKMRVVTAKRGDTLNRIAVRYGVGYNEIVRANPKLSRRKLRIGTQVIVPTAYVLPNIDHKGIVINLSAMRLYYFPNKFTVMTYPVAIGKRGWATPKANTTVVRKHPRPTWTPPKSIIREAAKKGKKLKKVYPAGPNNPLGTRALRLGIPGYLIHGTNKPWTIGKRRSHGCIRMRRNDVEELFEHVTVGTPVRIISQQLPLAKLPDLPEQEQLADTTPAVMVPKTTYKKKRKRKSYRKKQRAIKHNKSITDNNVPMLTNNVLSSNDKTNYQGDFNHFLASLSASSDNQQQTANNTDTLVALPTQNNTQLNNKAPAVVAAYTNDAKTSENMPAILTSPIPFDVSQTANPLASSTLAKATDKTDKLQTNNNKTTTPTALKSPKKKEVANHFPAISGQQTVSDRRQTASKATTSPTSADNDLPTTGKVNNAGAVILDSHSFATPHQNIGGVEAPKSKVKVITDLSELL